MLQCLPGTIYNPSPGRPSPGCVRLPLLPFALLMPNMSRKFKSGLLTAVCNNLRRLRSISNGGVAWLCLV